MPTVYKVLGQIAPTGNTETLIYQVPALTSCIISSVTIANRGLDLAAFRLSISVGGAITTNIDYIYYDVLIAGNDTFIATVGLTIAAGDEVRGYASGLGGDDLTFQLFGSEIT